jgi:hypothetical protein
VTPRSARRLAARLRSPRTGAVGEEPSRPGLIPADCWRDSYQAALTTAGVLAALVFGWLALLGVAALTRPLGLLLFHLSQGGHL